MKKNRKSLICVGCAVCLIAAAGCGTKGETGTEPESTAAESGAEPGAGTEGDAEAAEHMSPMRVATWNVDSKAHPDIKKMSEIMKENGI